MTNKNISINPVLIKGFFDTLKNVKNIPHKFKEGYKKNIRLGKLPKNSPEVKKYNEEQKKLAMKMVTSYAMTTTAVPGLSASLSTGKVPNNVDDLILEFNKYPDKKSYFDHVIDTGGLAKRAGIARERGYKSLIDFYERWRPL